MSKNSTDCVKNSVEKIFVFGKLPILAKLEGQ